MSTDLERVDLPLARHLEDVSTILERDRALLLEAQPGAGKSTLVPPSLLDRSWVAGGRILVLEPRRVAAAAVAARIADLLDEPLGQRAGYRVRSDARVGPRTRIEVITEALLTRRIQADPLLEGVSVVIFDELHERSIHADLALALTLEVRRARPDLAILAMSATPPTERVTAVLGARALRVQGSVHPVEVRYVTLPDSNEPRDRGWVTPFARSLLALALPPAGGGTLLAFLPGRPEIGRVRRALSEQAPPEALLVEELHGGLTLDQQRRVLAPPPGDRPRIILSTSIAETSLTVPGVRVVADTGWARTSQYHPASGMDRLVTHRVSASSAEQRRGRAGRLGPGLCVRYWHADEHLVPHGLPEILRTDLSALVLEARLWGARTPEELTWLDAPPASTWDRATELLRTLGFLDDEGRPTAAGSRAAESGLTPRLAALVQYGVRTERGELAAVMAAMLEERDGSGLDNDPDFRTRLTAYRTGGGDPGWRSAVEREAARIARAARIEGRRGWDAEDEEAAGEILARAYPDRVGRRQGPEEWRFPTGRVAKLRPGPGLPPPAGEDLEWCVAPVVDAGESMGTIRQAAPLGAGAAHQALEGMSREVVVVRWSGLRPRAFAVRRAGGITLGEKPREAHPSDVEAAFYARLADEGIGILPWSDALRARLERLRAFADAGGKLALGGAETLTDAALAREGERWLAGWLETAGGPVLTAQRLGSALSSLAADRSEVDRLVPESITLPTGDRRRIDYSGAEPAVEARIQEVFGLAATPRIAGRPLTIRLLSPAGRPLQITCDLESFWTNTYPEVRKEMRGRYPRHYWPEDPTTATPTRRVRPR